MSKTRPVSLRLPNDLLDYYENLAEKEYRSLTSQITLVLAKEKEKEEVRHS